MAGSNSIHRWIMSAVMCGAGALGCCRADTIFLTDGREVNGTIVSEDQQTVVVKTTRGSTRSIRRAEIDTIVREAVKVAEKEIEAPKTSSGVPVVVPVRPSQAAPGTDPVKKPAMPVVSAPATNPVVNAPPTSTRPLAAGGENPMPGFPPYAKRMSVRKEALLRDAMETIKTAYKNPEDTAGGAAQSDIQALGTEVVPYLWAGIQSEDSQVRASCARLIGTMNGRTCIKRVIETIYMTMPESSGAATWNVPFVDELKKTLISITGQTFITVEARRLGVQDGVKKYIEWYKANFKSLPRQVGEPELDANDVDYESKLAELRALQLTKRDWPHGDSLPTDLIAGPNKNGPDKPPALVIKDAERDADKKFGDTVPNVSDGQALKRPVDKPGAPEDDQALKRPVDRLVDQNANAPQNARRDPPTEVPSQKSTLPKDPLLRPQDLLKQQQNQQ